MNKNYLRHRPFLLVKQRLSPKPGVRTEIKGWMNDTSNFNVNELVSIIDSVSSKHMTESALIVDIMKETVIRNTIAPSNDTEVYSHYMQKYNQQVTEGTHIWMNKIANLPDKNKVKRIFDALGVSLEDTLSRDVESGDD